MIVGMNDEQPDDPHAVLIGEVSQEDLDGGALTAQLDQLVKDRRMLGLATRVKWSPDESDTKPAWMLVAVEAGTDEAVFAVKRFVEDDMWWRMTGLDAPWFALSTAGSLRASMLKGEPLHLKSAKSEALYKRVWEDPHPPSDEHGRL
jgi:hypothetical protein